LRAHRVQAIAVAVSPDGRYFASAGFGSVLSAGVYISHAGVRVWDAVSGDLVHDLHGHLGNVKTVAFSPDGEQLASGASDRRVIVWDVETGAKLASLEGHTGGVASIAFSPDGKQLYSSGSPPYVGAPMDGTVRVWDAHTGDALATLQHESAVDSVAIDPNGRLLATGSRDASIRVWKRETGEELFVLRGHERGVTSLAFNPEGTRLVSGSQDRTVRIWDLDTAESTVLRGHTLPVACVAVSPDGRRIASGSQSLRLWSMRTGDEVAVFEGDGIFLGVAFDPSGRRLVTTSMDGMLRVWEVDRDAASAMWHGASLRRRARAVIEPLFDELFFKSKVVAHLEADAALDEDLKHSAMLLVRARMQVFSNELNARAWPLVDPDRRRQDTDVALGLRLARAAVSLTSNASNLLDTLAWALYANALYERAIAESKKALELAPDENKDAFRGYLERMRAMVAER
jgi:WD40 repeat protein